MQGNEKKLWTKGCQRKSKEKGKKRKDIKGKAGQNVSK